MQKYIDILKGWYSTYKQEVWGVLGVIGAILVIWGIVTLVRSSKKEEAPVIEEPVVETPATSKSYTKPTTVVAPIKLSYNDALVKYTGRRIQFGENCNATPTRPVFKTGTEIMIDNRSSKARTFSIGDMKYQIDAYDYMTTILASASLPKEVLIDCGSNQNPVSILVER